MPDHPFDRELYRKFDQPGKEAVVLHLKSQGKDAAIESENYRFDILEKTPEGNLYHEVEVRSKWYGFPWKYPDISIPIRKLKQVNNPDYQPLYFWCVSPDLSEAYLVPASIVASSASEVERWSAGKTHQFLSVPIECWTYVKLEKETLQ